MKALRHGPWKKTRPNVTLRNEPVSIARLTDRRLKWLYQRINHWSEADSLDHKLVKDMAEWMAEDGLYSQKTQLTSQIYSTWARMCYIRTLLKREENGNP